MHLVVLRDAISETVKASPCLGGSSTLPRLHQKHGASGFRAITHESPDGGKRSGGPFIITTPEPSLVVATWKTGMNGGFGFKATIDFVSFAST